MFLLAFASISLLAGANNGKIKKIAPTKEKTSKKATVITVYSYTATCASGAVFTGCCWSTQAAAIAAGNAAMAAGCPGSVPPPPLP
jgi:hypothetical protein